MYSLGLWDLNAGSRWTPGSGHTSGVLKQECGATCRRQSPGPEALELPHIGAVRAPEVSEHMLKASVS